MDCGSFRGSLSAARAGWLTLRAASRYAAIASRLRVKNGMRLTEIFDRRGIRPSVLLNSDVATKYPQIIKAGTERGWAWLAHGRNNSTLQAGSGRVMALALHPFVSGQPFRAKYLDQALEYIAGHPGAWLTTSDEIAEHYARQGTRNR